MQSKKLVTTGLLLAGLASVSLPAYALGPAAQVNAGYACTNSGGNLILRAGPGQQFAKLAGISHGAKVVVLKEVVGRDQMSWYQVRVGKRSGWVRYDYVCGV